MYANLYLNGEVKKIEEIVYIHNTTRPNQIKPIFIDDNGTKWIGKEYTEKSFFQEYLASQLSSLINLRGFRFPELKLKQLNDNIWILSKVVEPKEEYGKDQNFLYLNSNERQVAILYRLMANIDGNFNNLIKDKKGEMWVFDFEYGGHFEDYDHLIRERTKTTKILSLLMRPTKREITEFKEGIGKIDELLTTRRLSKEALFEMIKDFQFEVTLKSDYIRNIMKVAENIEDKIRIMIDEWNAAIEIRKNNNTKIDLGNRI